MKKTKIITEAYSFKGFDWKTFLMGFKKPAIMVLTVGVTTIAQFPDAMPFVTALGGIAVVVERLWAVSEFFIKRIEK